jgi:hypothetical protein
MAFVLSTLPNAKNLMQAIASESGAGKDYLPTNTSSIQQFGANWVQALNCCVSGVSLPSPKWRWSRLADLMVACMY